jgi:hypothetical protein
LQVGYLLEFVWGCLKEGFHKAPTRCVDRYVDTAELVDRSGGERVILLLVGDVAQRTERLAGIALYEGVQMLGVTARDHHISALVYQALRNDLAHVFVTGGTKNDRFFAL